MLHYLKTNLENSKLKGSNLNFTDLRFTNLTKADLTRTSLFCVFLPKEASDLKGTNFKNTSGLSNEQKKFLREETEAINIPEDSKTLKERYELFKEYCE